MTALAPRWLLGAQAVDAADDPTIAAGVHVRLMPSPALGLPLVPFLVYRVNLGPNAANVRIRTDIVWRDSSGTPLTVPFDVHPSNPVTGYLPAPGLGVCCWIQLLSASILPIDPFPMPILGRGAVSRPVIGRNLTIEALMSTPLGDGVLAAKSSAPYEVAASRIEKIRVSGTGRVEQVRWVDARTVQPAATNFWHLLGLPVTAAPLYSGVAGAGVIAKQRVSTGAPRRFGLNDDPAALTAAGTPAATPANEVTRVYGLTPHVQVWLDRLLSAVGVPQTSVATPAQDLVDSGGNTAGKVTVPCLGAVLNAALDPGIGRWLGFVDIDVSPPGSPGDVIAYVVRCVWELNREELGRLLGLIPPDGIVADERGLAMVAPSGPTAPDQPASEKQCVQFKGLRIGEEMGDTFSFRGLQFEALGPPQLRMVDLLPVGAPDGVPELAFGPSGLRVSLPTEVSEVTVRVAAFGQFELEMDVIDVSGQVLGSVAGTAPAGSEETLGFKGASIMEVILRAHAGAAAGEALLAEICFPSSVIGIPPGAKGPFVDVWTVACATLGYPTDHPSAPVLDHPVNGPWVPATPPAAIREITVPMRGLYPGASLAAARRDGATLTSLNPTGAGGRALPIIVGSPAGATSPDCGNLHDSSAPPQAVAYRAAQTDWLGRWSTWREVAADAGTRPLPPRPVVNAFYRQASFGHPPPGGTLAGTIVLRVPVPATTSLAPGSNLLSALQVTVDGAATTTPLGGLPPAELEVTVPGPALAQCEQSTVNVRAAWVDSAGVISNPSDPVAVLCYDPRPPSQVSLPATLQYASRPDVTGKSRVLLTWPVVPTQQRFRVFYADETGLTGKLTSIASGGGGNAAAAQAILNSLAASMSAPNRAAVFVSHADFFTRDMWEQLTANPVPAAGSECSYEHQLSGSLRALSFYRVLGVSASNVDADFSSASMVAYAVPNTDPPSKPVLKLNLDPSAPAGQARLTVRVPQGATQAVTYRLRRSSITSEDAVRMPVALTGSAPAPTSPGPQMFDVVDLGHSEVAANASLRYWTRYQWRVEVQGAPEPGSNVPGAWSEPSAPVTGMLIPTNPPAAVANLSLTGNTLTWTHSDPLLGGSLGSYALQVYKQLPGASELLVGTISADAPPPLGGRSPSRIGNFTFTDPSPAPIGTRYRVVVVDPLNSIGAAAALRV